MDPKSKNWREERTGEEDREEKVGEWKGQQQGDLAARS